jgi:hypothetical protein
LPEISISSDLLQDSNPATAIRVMGRAILNTNTMIVNKYDYFNKVGISWLK